MDQIAIIDCSIPPGQNGRTTIRPLTPAEQALRVVDTNFARNVQIENIRIMRNSRLTESDWTQVADGPLNTNQKKLWKDYRQALRDMMSKITDPNNVVWPIPPTV